MIDFKLNPNENGFNGSRSREKWLGTRLRAEALERQKRRANPAGSQGSRELGPAMGVPQQWMVYFMANLKRK